MKASIPKDSKRPKAVRRPNALRGRRCLCCPFCAPSGACLDSRIRSGRCGDWVFYLLHGKQLRRLWNKPRDPRTPSQRYWRARLGAASRKYSADLTDEQQNTCIAAGAKRRSRPRLAQSGPLTGQQWWVQSQCAGKAEGAMRNAQTATKGLQTKGISISTWEPHRSTSVVVPWQHRRSLGRGSREEDRSENGQCGRQGMAANSKVGRLQGVTRPIGVGGPNTALAVRQWAVGNRGTFHVFSGRRPSRCAGGRRAGKVQADWRHGHGTVRRARGPPEQIETGD
jgi:hypothetical protein